VLVGNAALKGGFLLLTLALTLLVFLKASR